MQEAGFVLNIGQDVLLFLGPLLQFILEMFAFLDHASAKTFYIRYISDNRLLQKYKHYQKPTDKSKSFSVC